MDIMDMLSGNVVKPKAESQSAAAGLQAMLSFLSQGAQAPQQQEQGRPVDTGLIQMLMQHGAQQNEQDQADQGAALRKQLMGQAGEDRVPTPLLGAHDATEGSGFLGGKLTPQQVMAGLLGSKDKSTANFGAQMLNDQWAPKAPAQPHYMEMGVPGKEGYRVNAMMTPNGPQAIGEPWKSSTGVQVFTGEQPMMVPADGEDKAAWGIPDTIPATKNNKTGEVVPHPVAVTEDQGKSGMLAASLSKAHAGLVATMGNYDTNITANPKDWLADTISKIPTSLTEDVGNSLKSAPKQVFDTQSAEAETALVHLLSGQGFGEKEIAVKIKAAIPGWGDSDKVKLQKLNYLKSISDDAESRAGPGMPDATRERKALQTGPASWPRKEKMPTGWNDQLEAEYQRSLKGK